MNKKPMVFSVCDTMPIEAMAITLQKLTKLCQTELIRNSKLDTGTLGLVIYVILDVELAVRFLAVTGTTTM
jgi:hypothetical protein